MEFCWNVRDVDGAPSSRCADLYELTKFSRTVVNGRQDRPHGGREDEHFKPLKISLMQWIVSQNRASCYASLLGRPDLFAAALTRVPACLTLAACMFSDSLVCTLSSRLP